MKNQETIYLTGNQVCAMLSTTLTSLWRWRNSGVLQAYKLGGRVYYKKHEVEGALIPEEVNTTIISIDFDELKEIVKKSLKGQVVDADFDVFWSKRIEQDEAIPEWVAEALQNNYLRYVEMKRG